MKHRVSQSVSQSVNWSNQSVSQSVSRIIHLIPVFLLTLIACGGDDAPSGSSGPSPSVVYMWVSTQNTNGNIGGVNGATTICETDASTSAPIAGLTHRAVIATSANDPRNYFSNNPPVQRPNGTVITDTYADYFDPSVRLRNSTTGGYDNYWTGFTELGTASTDNCSSWTATTGQGNRAGTDASDNGRLTNATVNCTTTSKVLCISY